MYDATPVLRLYARWRRQQLAVQNPITAQARELIGLVNRASQTRFGRDHQFGRIHRVADFQERVPLRRYEHMWEEYWSADFPRLKHVSWPGLVPYYAVTSGTTTGRTKYIPCTEEMVNANRRTASDILVHHVHARPNSRIMAGRSFVLGGSTDLAKVADGVYRGDLSGIQAVTVPFWARGRYFPSPDLALLTDWEEKIDRLARASLNADIRSISGVPSWFLILFDKLFELRGVASQRLEQVYPKLELVVHGGINFAPYRNRFEDLLRDSHAELREAYAASEGFIAVNDAGPDDGMRLIVDNGLFFEFIPADELEADNPPRHWLKDVEPGVNYAIAVSSNAGLWAYVLGDTVRFTSLDPPRLIVTGRTSYSLSAFGEHLIEAEIEGAIAAAARQIGADVRDFAVGAAFPEQPGELGRHLYFVEFAGGRPPTKQLDDFGATVDARLREENEDYEAHRAEGFGMGAPDIRAVPPGTFASWLKTRGQLGGQHKVPRVINDPDLLEELRGFVAEAPA